MYDWNNDDHLFRSFTISQADIELIVEECEISKDKAETLLRKNQGKVKDAIISYINGA